MLFRLGSDPELMLRDSKTKALRSAIPVIVEGKRAGRPLDSSGENTVLHDNVLVEFNTKPAETEASFVRTIGDVLRRVSALVQENGLELHLLTAAEYPEEELQNEEARVFGCDPDFDAWNQAINIVPEGASELPFRSAGGHLHIGLGNDSVVNSYLEDDLGKLEVVKALDVFCGIPSVFLDKDATSVARRRLYGRAGCHRPKPYGVEYRALSPWWLASPVHTRLIWQLTAVALRTLARGKLDSLIDTLGPKSIQEIINNCQVSRAREVYSAHLQRLLPKKTAGVVAAVDTGVTDFRSSWKL